MGREVGGHAARRLEFADQTARADRLRAQPGVGDDAAASEALFAFGDSDRSDARAGDREDRSDARDDRGGFHGDRSFRPSVLAKVPEIRQLPAHYDGQRQSTCPSAVVFAAAYPPRSSVMKP